MQTLFVLTAGLAIVCAVLSVLFGQAGIALIGFAALFVACVAAVIDSRRQEREVNQYW